MKEENFRSLPEKIAGVEDGLAENNKKTLMVLVADVD